MLNAAVLLVEYPSSLSPLKGAEKVLKLPQGMSIESCSSPLVNIQKAIENGPFIVDLLIKHGYFP
jgi:hypothetical protein